MKPSGGTTPEGAGGVKLAGGGIFPEGGVKPSGGAGVEDSGCACCSVADCSPCGAHPRTAANAKINNAKTTFFIFPQKKKIKDYCSTFARSSPYIV